MVSYLLSAPDAPIRRLLLAQTGHSYLPRAIAAAGALAAVALVGAVLRGAVRGYRSWGDPLRWAATFRRLAVAQAAGFVVLEILERKAAGAPLGDLGGVLPRGLLVQGVVALAAATALWLLDRAGESVARAREAVPSFAFAVSAWEPAVGGTLPSGVPALGSISLRGPPLLARH